MPPLPTTLSPTAQALTESLQRKILHTSKTLIPELRDFSGALVTQQELSEDVRESVGGIARDIEVLDAMVDDQRGEKARRELRGLVEDFRKDVAQLRTDMRAAILSSKRAVDALKKSNRDELLYHPSLSEKSETPRGTDPTLQSAQEDLTSALSRTLALMSDSLSTSVHTTQLLQSSTASLKSTSTTHDTLSFTLDSTKLLVTALEKSDWTDRVLIMSAFAFFLSVVAFVLKQRVLDRGIAMLGWFFWWAKYVPGLTGSSKGAGKDIVEEVLKGSSVPDVVQTAVTTLSTVAAVSTSLSWTAEPSSAPPAPEQTEAVSEILSVALPPPAIPLDEEVGRDEL